MVCNWYINWCVSFNLLLTILQHGGIMHCLATPCAGNLNYYSPGHLLVKFHEDHIVFMINRSQIKLTLTMSTFSDSFCSCLFISSCCSRLFSSICVTWVEVSPVPPSQSRLVHWHLMLLASSKAIMRQTNTLI